MRLWRHMAAVVVATAMLWSGAALAEVKSTNCDPVRFPPTVEGQVVKINKEEGKVTMRTSDGTVHEFQASKETLQDLKVGDRIAAKLRNAPNC
jgi:aconitase B